MPSYKIKYKAFGHEESSVKKEKEEAKMIAKFEYTDGSHVIMTNGSIHIRSPFMMNVAPNTRQTIKLGVKCDRRLIVYENARLRDSGLRSATPIRIFEPGEEIVIDLENTSGSMKLLEHGDIVARANVLDSSDVEIVHE